MGQQPIHFATKAGNAESLGLLLDLGANPNEPDTHSRHRPLDGAVKADSLECVEILITAGADPNFCNERNETPIFSAKSVPVLQRLLQAGAKTDLRNHHNQGLLRYSALRVVSPEVLRHWLDAGMSVDDADDQGRTELHGLLEHGVDDVRINNDDRMRCLELLLDAGADINHTDLAGRSVLHHAAWHCHADTRFLNRLLERDADPNLADHYGNVPLMLAAQQQSLTCVNLLLEHGADPSLPNDQHVYPLKACPPRSEVAKILRPVTKMVPKRVVQMNKVLDRVFAIPRYAECESKPCSDEEIENLELQIGTTLPDSYRLFLARLGHGISDFMVCDHFSFQIDWVLETAKQGYEKQFDYAILPDDAVIFATRLGDWTVLFRSGARAKDPPVYAIEWDGDDKRVNPKKIARSITDFFDDIVTDHERWLKESS